MIKKINKTLYLPDWIADLLDSEGTHYDGPGVVASAAIDAFCKMKNGEKVKIIQSYRNEEVRRAYLDSKKIVESAGEDEAGGKKQK